MTRRSRSATAFRIKNPNWARNAPPATLARRSLGASSRTIAAPRATSPRSRTRTSRDFATPPLILLADAARELAAEERSHHDTSQLAVAFAAAHDALRKETTRVDEVTFDACAREKRSRHRQDARRGGAAKTRTRGGGRARVAARREARDSLDSDAVRRMGRTESRRRRDELGAVEDGVTSARDAGRARSQTRGEMQRCTGGVSICSGSQPWSTGRRGGSSRSAGRTKSGCLSSVCN